MENYIHPNAYRSSNLFRLSALLGLLGYLLLDDQKSVLDSGVISFSIALLIGSAYLVRKGYNWIRWAWAILFIPGILLQIIALSAIFKASLLEGCFSILQSIVQTVAVILLFIPYKILQDELAESEM
ncbi:MAG TPA: hypothetical protein VGI43_06005 [Mucilaginibacter sp.]|jgi:hypothetical protein